MIGMENRKIARKRRLSDPEPDLDYLRYTPAERLAMVWPLTLTCWDLMGATVVESRSNRRHTRVLRGKG